MKLGCGTVLFNQLDLYGALQHIAWAGYQGVELACMANMAQHIELNTRKTYIDEVKAIAKKHVWNCSPLKRFLVLNLKTRKSNR